MAVTADKVVVELEAKLNDYNNKIRGAASASDKAFDQIGKAANDAERDVSSSLGKTASAAERAFARMVSAAKAAGTGVKQGFSEGWKKGLEDARRDAEKAGESMDKALFGRLKDAASGFLAGLSVDKLISITMQGLDYASSLGEIAQQLGVTTDQLQVYRYAATQVGISQDEMDQGLAKLSKSLGDAALGSKQDEKIFKALGISIRDAAGNVKTAGDVLPEIADALKQIPDPAVRATLEMQIFGRAGQRLDTLLSGGSSAIDELTRAAKDLGVVLSADQIQNADRTADKLAELKQVLAANIASAVANNASSIYDLANSFIKLAAAVPGAIDRWRQWRAENTIKLANEIDSSPLGFLPESFKGTGAARRDAQRTLNAISERQRRDRLALSGLILTPGSDPVPADFRPKRAAPRVGDLSGLLGTGGGNSRRRSGSTKSEVDDLAKSIVDLQAHTRDALRDVEQLLYTNPQENTNRASRRFYDMIGIDPNEEFKALVQSIDKERDARFALIEEEAEKRAEANEKNAARMDDRIRTTAQLYEDLMRGGTKAFLRDLEDIGLRIIAELAARMTFGGQGFGSALQGALGSVLPGFGATGGSNSGGFNLGGIFNPVLSLFGRASGGYVAPGQLVRVNEAASPGRVEGFRPQGSGTIIPLGQMNAAIRGGGTTVIQHVSINAPNSILANEILDRIEQSKIEAARAGAQGGRMLAQQDMAQLTRTRM